VIEGISNSGALPVLEKTLQFAAQRQKLLAHNVANMETPDFRPLDVSVGDFQKSLARAVKERREGTASSNVNQGPLPYEGTREVVVGPGGRLTLNPRTASGNVLYHDRNNRDLERMMQDLAENGLMYKATVDLLRREHDILRTAISQRV
jgi:flagellar basal-body rod protein FlgB